MFNVLKNDGKAKYGDLIIDGKSFPAISGLYGLGALPDGRYKIDSCYPLKVIKGKTEPYTNKSFPWVAKIFPEFETNRKGFLIHPDGGVVGTRGCIGISKEIDDIHVYNKISNLMKTKKYAYLIVGERLKG